jgi:hypothetical protein
MSLPRKNVAVKGNCSKSAGLGGVFCVCFVSSALRQSVSIRDNENKA